MSEEDKKIFELTKNNTIINRDIQNKEKEYLKNIESTYQEIYGDKGVKFCEEENKKEGENIQNEENKEKGKVKFSSIVEYYRN